MKVTANNIFLFLIFYNFCSSFPTFPQDLVPFSVFVCPQFSFIFAVTVLYLTVSVYLKLWPSTSQFLFSTVAKMQLGVCIWVYYKALLPLMFLPSTV